jgi:hypothetical protein
LFGDRQSRVGQCVVRIEPDRLAEMGDGLEVVGAVSALGVIASLQQRIVRSQVAARRFVRGLDRAAEQCGLQGAGNRRGDLRLHREHVLQPALIGLRPELAAVGRIDQRRDDADRVALLAHGALQQRRHPQPVADRGRIVLLRAAELERGIAADHLQVAYLAERGDQLFRQAVGKIVLRRIAALVQQRQDGDRLHRRRDRSAIRRRAARQQVRRQEHDGDSEYADDHAIELAPGRMGDRILRRDLAFALQPLRGEFVEPGECEPERKADAGGDHEPARAPVRRAQRGAQLRDALGQRPRASQVKHARAQHVAALELGEDRRGGVHGRSTGAGV